MERQRGFTIIELMVTLAIVGILFATAAPIYHTWQQRAYGSEAAVMLKQLISAEIAYFLDNNKFFPDNDVYTIPHEGDTSPSGVNVIKEIQDNLNITINQGHFLTYSLAGVNEPGNESFVVTIQSKDRQFDLFKGTDTVIASLDKNGNAEYSYPSY